MKQSLKSDDKILLLSVRKQIQTRSYNTIQISIAFEQQ